MRDALYWSGTLRPIGVPLPEVLHCDTSMECFRFPFMVLERLSGRDLGLVVEQMSLTDLSWLAKRLVRIQHAVGDLSSGRGFGYAARLEGPFPHTGWGSVVTASIEQSRERIRNAGVFDEGQADRVASASRRLADYLCSVPAVPFLHDITTRNVIIGNSQLTGIVDVDDLCFGDLLLLIGLIRTALLSDGWHLHYADIWTQLPRSDADQQAALSFYTAVFCLDFMSEIGHRFNRATAAPVDHAQVDRLEILLGRSLAI